MATSVRQLPLTLAGTFSFYVPATDTATLAVVGSLADGATVKGPGGPAVVRRLRVDGWDAPVIFDAAGYDPSTIAPDPEEWFARQVAAGADRLVTSGSWVAWSTNGDTLARAVEIESARSRRHPKATLLFAIDHRWLTKAPHVLGDTLQTLGQPCALVLAHPTDPLSPSHAVEGLVAVTRNVSNLSVLRTDHGGLGALVYGAGHAAIGLLGSYRHLVPPGQSGGGKRGDSSPRIFVPALMDWFTGMTISGWTTARVNLHCLLPCCSGRGLDRFFDPRFDAEAMVHNRISISHLADEVLNAPAEERRRHFSQVCAAALDQYGPMGKLSMVTKAKSQLNQWTFA